MDMNQVNQWSQTEEAQPYLAKYGVQTQAQPQQMGGQGMYNQYLMELINANQGNPSFQQNMLGYYLDSANPANQPDPYEQQYQLLQNQLLGEQVGSYQSDNQSNIALSLLSSDNPELQGYGMVMLKSLIPELSAGDNAIAEVSPYDAIRNNAGTQYSDMSAEGNVNLDQLKWLQYLNKASNSQIDAYNQAPTMGERVTQFGGGGEGNNRFGRTLMNSLFGGIPGFIDMLSGEKIKKERTGYRG